ARETQAGQHLKERGRGLFELRQGSQIGDFRRRELQVLEIFDRLCQPGGEHEVPVPGQAPQEQLEGGSGRGFAGLEEARRHGELVEIGVERRPKLRTLRLGLVALKRAGHYFVFPSFGAGGGGSLTPVAASRRSLTAFESI